MKTFLTFLSVFCVYAAAAAGRSTLADQKTAILSAPTESGPMKFAADEIENVLKNAGWTIVKDYPAALEITLESADGTRKTGEKPESFQIEVSQAAGSTQVRIRGADPRGVMYGGLDVAEQIRMHGPLAVKPKSESPSLPVRAMKFNLPLKGTGYMSEEDEKHNAWFYDLKYWDRFLRTMAYDRYNALSFWSAHPYDQMVRLQKYPEATTLPAAELDRNIAHFHKVFQRAKDCGLDLYLVTWNIHMAPGFRKAQQLKDGQDSPLIRDYEKQCIKELLQEYPELTGLGTCPGEKMPMSAEANAEWIRDVYLDTLAGTGRKMPFIYRYWGARPKETAAMLLKAKYPGEILLDIKFNGEHMYSSVRPHPEQPLWLTQSPRPYKLLWHLRNDDIYQLRWGDPEFAGQVLSHCGGPDSAGFVTGSEVEIPGADRIHTPQTAGHRTWDYEFEKNWMRFAVWGRMGYDPQLSDDYWIDRFAERFGVFSAKNAFLALKFSSKIIPTTTSFHWNYMNGDWYPEGNVGSWNTSAGMKKRNFREDGIFHDIREWIFNNVIDGTMQNIPDYVATCILKGEKTPEDVLTPLQVAAMLDRFAEQSENHAQAAAAHLEKGEKEWQCMQLDLKASAALGRYYAEKIRAAVELMIYLATGEEDRKSAAVEHLEKAREDWKILAEVTQSHYLTHEVWLMGQFNWMRYLPDVEKDLDMARAMKPWGREEQTWTCSDGNPITVPTRWRAEGWPKEIEPWVEDFTSRARGMVLPQDVTPGSWMKTTLTAESAGTCVISIFSQGLRSIKINYQDYPVAEGRVHLLAARLRAGKNEIAVQFDRDCHVAPIVELEAAPAPIFLEAEAGRLTSPMQKSEREDAVGGAALVAPRGAGRGEKNGKVLENGYATYKINIPADGSYCLRARVFWENGENNSLFYAWDHDSPEVLGNDNAFGRWHWIESKPKTLTAGEHALMIRNREENSVIDCFQVVPEESDAADNKGRGE